MLKLKNKYKIRMVNEIEKKKVFTKHHHVPNLYVQTISEVNFTNFLEIISNTRVPKKK